MILILVVVVFGFFTLAVAFGVTLTLMVHEPGRSAFTEVPEMEQNFLVVTATTSTTLAPLGTLTFAVLLSVVKEVTLPFFITATLDTISGVYVPVLVLTDDDETRHGTLFIRTQIVFEATAPVARTRYFVEAVGQITKVAFPFVPVFATIIAEHPAFALTRMARTIAALSSELVDTPPLAQMVETLSVDETRPPCSQLVPELTGSTD